MEFAEAVPASPPDAQQRFERLQERLVPLWKSIESFNQDPQTIVVIPSMTLDHVEGAAPAMQPYEERYLFLLLLLRQPRARLVYVTSQPIHPSVIDYYLDLLPGVIPSHARPRLFTVPVLDGAPIPLSVKLLERPRLIERIRALIPDPARAHLVPYNTTELQALIPNPEVRRCDGKPEKGLRIEREEHVQDAHVQHHLYLVRFEITSRSFNALPAPHFKSNGVQSGLVAQQMCGKGRGAVKGKEP